MRYTTITELPLTDEDRMSLRSGIYLYLAVGFGCYIALAILFAIAMGIFLLAGGTLTPGWGFRTGSIAGMFLIIPAVGIWLSIGVLRDLRRGTKTEISSCNDCTIVRKKDDVFLHFGDAGIRPVKISEELEKVLILSKPFTVYITSRSRELLALIQDGKDLYAD